MVSKTNEQKEKPVFANSSKLQKIMSQPSSTTPLQSNSSVLTGSSSSSSTIQGISGYLIAVGCVFFVFGIFLVAIFHKKIFDFCCENEHNRRYKELKRRFEAGEKDGEVVLIEKKEKSQKVPKTTVRGSPVVQDESQDRIVLIPSDIPFGMTSNNIMNSDPVLVLPVHQKYLRR